MTDNVCLREAEDGDIPVFIMQQRDPEATHIAGFQVWWEDDFRSPRLRIQLDEINVLLTILSEGKVAGNIVGWEQDGNRRIGCWIISNSWAKGITSQALAQFLTVVRALP